MSLRNLMRRNEVQKKPKCMKNREKPEAVVTKGITRDAPGYAGCYFETDFETYSET